MFDIQYILEENPHEQERVQATNNQGGSGQGQLCPVKLPHGFPTDGMISLMLPCGVDMSENFNLCSRIMVQCYRSEPYFAANQQAHFLGYQHDQALSTDGCYTFILLMVSHIKVWSG